MKTTAIAFVAAIALAGVTNGETLNLNCDWQFRRDCDETWQRVSVPHCVNAHDTFDGHAGAWGEKDQWRGTMFYRKRFALPWGTGNGERGRCSLRLNQ